MMRYRMCRKFQSSQRSRSCRKYQPFRTCPTFLKRRGQRWICYWCALGPRDEHAAAKNAPPVQRRYHMVQCRNPRWQQLQTANWTNLTSQRCRCFRSSRWFHWNRMSQWSPWSPKIRRCPTCRTFRLNLPKMNTVRRRHATYGHFSVRHARDAHFTLHDRFHVEVRFQVPLMHALF